MEGELAEVFKKTRVLQASDDFVISVSKEYRRIIFGHKSKILPLWHAIELLHFRALSPTGLSSDVNWFEFGLALADFYKKHFYSRYNDGLVRSLLARDWDSIRDHVEIPVVDLRSGDAFLALHNQWRQVSALNVVNEDLKNIFNAVGFEGLISKYHLNWLEQLLLCMFYYPFDGGFPRKDDWEGLFNFVDETKAEHSQDTVLWLVKLVFSGQLLSALANLSDSFPADVLWFCCHITDLLYFNTSSWLDPELRLERPLNDHFLKLYADSLVENSMITLSFEYYRRLGEDGVASIIKVIMAIEDKDDLNDAIGTIQDILDSKDELKEQVYLKLLSMHANDLKEQLKVAIRSNSPNIIDMVCQEYFNILQDKPLDIGVGQETDATAYPSLQLLIDYNDFLRLYEREGPSEVSVKFLSRLIVYQRIGHEGFLSQFISFLLKLHAKVGLKSLSEDAQYKLLDTIEHAVNLSEKQRGEMRASLLNAISESMFSI